MVNKILKAAKRKAKYFLLNNKSELYLVGGATCIVVGNVLNCNASRKLDEVLDRHKENLEIIHDEAEEGKITEKEERSCVTTQYFRTGMAFVKLFGPGVLLNIAGFGMGYKSHKILKNRNAGLVAAYGTLSTAYSKYRERVIADIGEDKDLYYKYGIEKKEVTEVVTDDLGREIEKKTTVDTFDPENGFASPYTFAISSNPDNFDDFTDPLYLKQKLVELQADFNGILQREGVVFLNDILRRLEKPGDPNSIHPIDDGQIVGWLKDGDGDGYIDFNIFKARNKEFINGNSNTCIIEFNVDGPILGKNCFRRS